MRISDWSSDVCSSDLAAGHVQIYLLTGQSQPASCLQHRQYHGKAAGIPAHHGTPRGGLRGGGNQGLNFNQEGAGALEPGEDGGAGDVAAALGKEEIGRASCRERVCQYGSISVGAVSLKKKKSSTTQTTTKN